MRGTPVFRRLPERLGPRQRRAGIIIRNTAAKKPKPGGRFVFPDPPEPEERGADDVTSFDHLSINGNAYLLSKHLGNPEKPLIAEEHYLARGRSGI